MPLGYRGTRPQPGAHVLHNWAALGGDAGYRWCLHAVVWGMEPQLKRLMGQWALARAKIAGVIECTSAVLLAGVRLGWRMSWLLSGCRGFVNVTVAAGL